MTLEVRSSTSREALGRALGHARAARHASCRRWVDRALEAAPDDPLTHLLAAGLSFVSRDHQRALDRLAWAARHPDLFRLATEDLFRFAGALGWDQVVRTALDEAMQREPNEVRWPVLAMRLYTRADAPGRARAMARRALDCTQRSVRLRLEAAHLAAVDGAFEEATDGALEVLAARGSDLRLVGAACDVLLSAGAFSKAPLEALGDAGRTERVELALARGDTETALGLASALPPAVARRTWGAVAMLRGDVPAAVAHLERALSLDPEDYVSLTWRAEAALRAGDAVTADACLDRATMRAPSYFFAARLLRYLVADAGRDDPDEHVGAHRLEEFRGPLLEIVPEAESALREGAPEGIAAAIERALARMHGNRTVRATYVDEAGDLRLVRERTGVRFASRTALQWIRTLPAETTVAALDAVVDRYPGASLPVCHRGELQLWLGNLEAAERDLWRAVELHRWTRWAYIGLSGIELTRGRPRNALMASAHGVEVMGGTTGPAVFVYRGEAHLRLGALDAARADLEQAVRLTPTRVGAWVGLALTYDRLGEADRFEAAWQRLVLTAPGLLSTGAAARGIAIFVDPGTTVSRASRCEVLEACLIALRGNRSTSCATYFDPRGRLRFVQPFSSEDVAVHRRDEAVLNQVERRLRRGVGRG